jgi:hypothetical protein
MIEWLQLRGQVEVQLLGLAMGEQVKVQLLEPANGEQVDAPLLLEPATETQDKDEV